MLPQGGERERALCTGCLRKSVKKGLCESFPEQSRLLIVESDALSLGFATCEDWLPHWKPQRGGGAALMTASPVNK